jgi:hypothetical protein
LFVGARVFFRSNAGRRLASGEVVGKTGYDAVEVHTLLAVLIEQFIVHAYGRVALRLKSRISDIYSLVLHSQTTVGQHSLGNSREAVNFYVVRDMMASSLIINLQT